MNEDKISTMAEWNITPESVAKELQGACDRARWNRAEDPWVVAVAKIHAAIVGDSCDLFVELIRSENVACQIAHAKTDSFASEDLYQMIVHSVLMPDDNWDLYEKFVNDIVCDDSIGKMVRWMREDDIVIRDYCRNMFVVIDGCNAKVEAKVNDIRQQTYGHGAICARHLDD